MTHVVLDRLLARAVRTESGCLVLPQHVDLPRRYAVVKVGRRTVRAHRFVYEIAHGPTALYVCHSCDHPPCFALEHLFAGTQADNMLDMYAKERRVPLRGPEHPQWVPDDQKQTREEKNAYLRAYHQKKRTASA